MKAHCILLASAALVACVDTDVESIAVFAECASAASPDSVQQGIVRVDAQLDFGTIICSGVAIAKTLVVTGFGCVVRPSRWADPNPDRDPEFRNPPSSMSFYGSAREGDVCQRGAAWTPLEDGSLSARPGQRIDADALEVRRVGGARVLTPTAVITPDTTSRCSDGLALLVFEQELDVTPLPVRLDDTPVSEEPLTLAAYCRSSPEPTLGLVDSRLEAVTADLGDEDLPPRSVLASGDATALGYGGAVISAESGAVIGVITSGLSQSCAERDPDGETLAIRLAPFRRMLLETAAAEGVELRREQREGEESGLPACATP
jgi:hypothetical protein